MVVSVHDVAPSNSDGVRWLVGELDRAGIGKRVFKAVARWKEREALADDTALVELLRDEAARGSEIVVHGWSHVARGRLRGGWPTRLRARLFAPHDAEFVCYEPDEAAALAGQARAELADLGLPARGFCAPGWLGGPGLDDALAGAGFDYAIKFAGVTRLQPRRWIRAPAVGYMGAGSFSERLTGIENALTLHWPVEPQVLRVFLHPRDAASSTACAAALRTLPELATRREVVTYAELLS